MILTEMLARRLDEALTDVGVVLDDDLDARMAALTVAAPAMMRWHYLLDREQSTFVQTINLYEAAERGYVPLSRYSHLRKAVALALRQRADLRAALGHTTLETTRDALAGDGFVADSARGESYLPTGLDTDALSRACRSAGGLENARDTLPWPDPTRLDPILIGGDTTGLIGVNLVSGDEVRLP